MKQKSEPIEVNYTVVYCLTAITICEIIWMGSVYTLWLWAAYGVYKFLTHDNITWG